MLSLDNFTLLFAVLLPLLAVNSLTWRKNHISHAAFYHKAWLPWQRPLNHLCNNVLSDERTSYNRIADRLSCSVQNSYNHLVPEHTDVDVVVKFEHIKNWTNENKMILNI